MSIAEKLTTIAENQQKVYEAGQKSGGYDQGYEDGKNSVVDIARCASTIQYVSRNLMKQSEITVSLDKAIILSHLFNNTSWSGNTIVEHITVNVLNPITLCNGMFHAQEPNDTVLKHITLNGDISQVANPINMFRGNEALEIIDGTPLNFSGVSQASYMNIFNGCKNLKEVRFVKESIKWSFTVSYFKDLSADTIQSIIDGLADLSSGTAQTLTLHATVGAKLTDEQRATITAKNWTLVY